MGRWDNDGPYAYNLFLQDREWGRGHIDGIERENKYYVHKLL